MSYSRGPPWIKLILFINLCLRYVTCQDMYEWLGSITNSIRKTGKVKQFHLQLYYFPLNDKYENSQGKTLKNINHNIHLSKVVHSVTDTGFSDEKDK